MYQVLASKRVCVCVCVVRTQEEPQPMDKLFNKHILHCKRALQFVYTTYDKDLSF